jgi:DNA-binding NarL/FixJ family response regulator
MNEERIVELLKAGYSMSEVAEDMDTHPKRLYHIAKKYNLPYNAPIKDGGPKEMRILRLHNSGFSVEDIGKIFSQASINVEKIIKKHISKEKK